MIVVVGCEFEYGVYMVGLVVIKMLQVVIKVLVGMQ